MEGELIFTGATKVRRDIPSV